MANPETNEWANDESVVVTKHSANESSQSLEYEHGPPWKLQRKLKYERTKRGGVKHNKNKNVKFSLLGNNSAGIKAKTDSLEAVIKILGNPSCITLQETKLSKNNIFQLNGYQVFQKK